MQASDIPYETCSIVILAAGASARLQQPKQLLQFNGKTLIQHMIETALHVVAKPVVILGSSASLIEKNINDMAVDVVINADWNKGMGSSIRVGISTLLEKKLPVEHVILVVCDQPFVTPALLKSLVAKHYETSKKIIACAYDDTLGTPVLFNKKYFNELMTLTGKEGAKKLITKHAEDVASIDFALGRVDIDTIEDYQSLLKISIGRSGK